MTQTTPSYARSDLALMTMIIFVYATVCMETDIYVPAFPDMRLFFNVSDEAIQRVLSINFLGICIGSLIFGPLSDSLGRKQTMQAGLFLFAVSSWGCVFFTDFDLFLLNRFIQGLGAAAPMAISFAIILDKFDPARSAQLCGFLNIFITGVMAAAPLLGSYLNIHYGWQSNFLWIAILATLSWLGGFALIPESLPLNKRLPLSLGRISRDYGRIVTSFPYMAGTLVCYLLFSAMIMFVSNQSLIYMEYMGVSKEVYGFYQAAPAAMFALCSFLSIGFIGRFGMDAAQTTGLVASLVGTLLLVAFTFLVEQSPLLITIAMVIITAGITFSAPIFAIKAANAIPDLKGSAAGMNNALRHVVVAGFVALSGFLFTGTVTPVTLLIICLMGITLVLTLQLRSSPKQLTA